MLLRVLTLRFRGLGVRIHVGGKIMENLQNSFPFIPARGFGL